MSDLSPDPVTGAEPEPESVQRLRTPAGATLELFDDPQAFLDVATPLLTAEPVLGSVIASVTGRMAAGRAADPERAAAQWAASGADFQPWWLALRDAAGEVVSAGMRTAPFAPYFCFLLPMPDDAVISLAGALHERGEWLGGANGALPAAEVLAAETARLVGGDWRVVERTRLFEVTEVIAPADPGGTLRRARRDEAGTVLAWYRAFDREADEQAGREPDPAAGVQVTADEIVDRIDQGVVWVVEGSAGTLVHLTMVSPPAFGVSRIGPVYTPAEHRGRGYAGHTVAVLTERLLADGVRACLFTDQANPVSNALYQRIGYRAVVDMANLEVRPG